MADGRSIDLLAGTKDDLPTLPDRLERLKPARVWLISFNQLPDDEFLAAFTPDYRCVTQAQWRGSAVWLFYSSAPAPQDSTD